MIDEAKKTTSEALIISTFYYSETSLTRDTIIIYRRVPEGIVVSIVIISLLYGRYISAFRYAQTHVVRAIKSNQVK
jgi:hypothetical protein